MIYTILMAWLMTSSLALLAWIIFLRLNRPEIIDVFWSVMISTAGAYFILARPLAPSTVLLLVVLLLWGIRLCLYLFYIRFYQHSPDSRYRDLVDKWRFNQAINYFLNYQLQAILALVIAAPFLLASTTHVSVFSVICGVLAIAMVVLESISDLQLYHFLQTKPKAVCNIGLWKYSRHPNLFFELCFWWLIFLMSCHALIGLAGIVSPLLVMWVILVVTLPITEEKSMRKRGVDFIAYCETTPRIIPWPQDHKSS